MGVSDEVSDTELDEDLAEAAGETRARGRNGARGKRGRKVTQVTKREFVEDPDDDDNTTEDLPPLFDIGDIEEKSVARIRVTRKDPAEGMLGYLEDPNANEAEIAERWGGSTYRLDGLNQNGQIVVARTIKLAGDPIFVSASAELQWRKARGLPTGQVAGGQPPMSFTEMMAFVREMSSERQKADDERRERDARERREHDERMRKLELEAEERRRKDESEREERRRKDEAEREERRRQQAIEDDKRRAEAATTAMTMQQTFMQAMITATKQSAEQALAFAKQTTQQQAGGPNAMMDAVKMVVAIKQAFAGDGAETGDDDPLALVIKHGGEWLQGLGGAVQGAIREIKGGGAAPGQPALPAVTQPAADGGLSIPATSPLAGKLNTLVTKIAERGQNPETVLAGVVDQLNATLDGQQPPPVQPNTSAPGQSPAGPAFIPYPANGVGAPATPAPAPVATQPMPPVPNGAPKPPARARVAVNRTERGSYRLAFG